MGVLNTMFGPRMVNTPMVALETIRTYLDKYGYFSRKIGDSSLIIGSDRADLALINVKIYARSVDIWAFDSAGTQIMAVQTYRGRDFRGFFRWIAKRLARNLDILAESALDGYRIRPRFAQMMREIAYI